MRKNLLGKLLWLKTNTSPGPEGLNPRVLKQTVVVIMYLLVVIYQNYLDS